MAPVFRTSTRTVWVVRTSGRPGSEKWGPLKMAKRRASPARPIAAATDEDVQVVGGREPCPCGSGRRYKACHGKAAATQHRVVRPFAGMASEPDWVALHDLVPSATATLKAKVADRSVTLCTLLPMAWPALVRQNGDVLLAAQTQTSSADVARDLGDALARALAAEPGTPVPPRPLPADAPHLTDLIDAGQPLRCPGPLRIRLLARRCRDSRRQRACRARTRQRGRQSHRPTGISRGCLLDAARRPPAGAVGTARGRGAVGGRPRPVAGGCRTRACGRHPVLGVVSCERSCRSRVGSTRWDGGR